MIGGSAGSFKNWIIYSKDETQLAPENNNKRDILH